MYHFGRNRRALSVGIITLFFYIYLLYILFGGSWVPSGSFQGVYAVRRIVLSCVFLGLNHFLAIEIQHVSSRNISLTIAGLCILACIGGLLAGASGLLLVLCILFHVGYASFLLAKLAMFYAYKFIPSWTLVTHGVYKALMLFTLIFCVMIASSWKTIDIDCMKLFAGWEYVVGYLPDGLNQKQVTPEAFSSISMGELLGVQEEDISLFIKNMTLLEEARSLGNDLPKTKKVTKLNEFKNFILDELSADKNLINEGFCALIIEQITKKKQSALFIYSTSFLLFFLLYPFVKIVNFFISLIAYMVFSILAWFGIYIRQEIVGSIEEII